MASLASRLKSWLPAGAYQALRGGYRWCGKTWRRIRHRGSARYCPICRSHLRAFMAGGTDNRPEALCPVCGSYDRHRFAMRYLDECIATSAATPVRMLHVAPEPGLSARLRQDPGVRYLSGDLHLSDVDVKFSLTALPFPDASFDLFFCSHVLEHIPEDREAIAELVRVLAPGGEGVVQVPVEAETTLEDVGADTPEKRIALYGQDDHFRRPGKDYGKRFCEYGCTAEYHEARELDEAERCRLGVPLHESVFLIHKPASL